MHPNSSKKAPFHILKRGFEYVFNRSLLPMRYASL